MSIEVAVAECDSYERTDVTGSVQKVIDLLGGINRFVKPGSDVLIKPNLCLPSSPEECLTTHPEIVRHIVHLCLDAGSRVTIGDSPVGKADKERMELVWERTGMGAVAEDMKCGLSSLNSAMNIYDFVHDGKNRRLLISNEVSHMDSVINVPKLKTHSLMTLSGSVKNLFGLLPESTKRWLHMEIPERDGFAALLVRVYELVRPCLHIMDAVVGIQGEGPGARGERRKIGLIMASTDGVALDSVAARLMSMEPNDVPTNRLGNQACLGGSDLGEIKILGTPIENYIMPDCILPMTHRYGADLTRKIFGMKCLAIEVDQERCHKCRLCSANCPANAICMRGDGFIIDRDRCIACMICHEICPEGAILFKRVTYSERLMSVGAKKTHKCGETDKRG